MFKVRNENDLLRLLKMISEESVSLSRRSLSEASDPYVDNYMGQYKSDEKVFGSLSEQEEAEEETPPEEEEAPPEEEDEAPPEEEDEAPPEEDADASPEESPDEETSVAFGASFDSVLTAINALRAGRSLKDDAIKQATSSYYDSLSSEEREVLLLFLKSLSEILSGGDKIHDPSEDPYNYVITKGGEEDEAPEAEAEEVEEEVEGEEPEGEETPPDEEPDEEGDAAEDTSPPIKVNESQDFTSVRRKIRRLIIRG